MFGRQHPCALRLITAGSAFKKNFRACTILVGFHLIDHKFGALDFLSEIISQSAIVV